MTHNCTAGKRIQLPPLLKNIQLTRTIPLITGEKILLCVSKHNGHKTAVVDAGKVNCGSLRIDATYVQDPVYTRNK